jgi:hypothetical protein
MRNIPVDLRAFRFMISEAPAVKMRSAWVNGVKEQEPVVDRDTGVVLYVVPLFVKRDGERGEEIKVTLPGDPGDGFDEGARVELVAPTLSPYSFKNDKGEEVSGVSWRAEGLKLAARTAASRAAA